MASTSTPTQMKAQFLEAFGSPYEYKTVPVPEFSSENDILVKVDAAGYCHTDAMLTEGLLSPGQPNSLPHIGSHEFAGTIIALSPSPSEAAKALPIGTRIGVPGRGFHVCGSCFECKDPNNDTVGYSNYCPYSFKNGLSRDGGFSEYAVVDARQVALLPDDMSAVQAAPLMCAGVTIYNALKRCCLSRGQRVAIIGAGGGLGHLGLQFADAMGLRTIGVDAADGPLKVAKSLGTSATIVDARSFPVEDLVEQVGKEDTIADQANKGVDAVIILAESQASFNYGVKLLRNHGLCVVLSIQEKGFQVSSWDLVYRDISVVGSMLGTKIITSGDGRSRRKAQRKGY